MASGDYRAQAEGAEPRPAAPRPAAPRRFPLRPYFPAMAWALGTAALAGAAFGEAGTMAPGPTMGALAAAGLVLTALCLAGSLFLAGEAS